MCCVGYRAKPAMRKALSSVVSHYFLLLEGFAYKVCMVQGQFRVGNEVGG